MSEQKMAEHMEIVTNHEVVHVQPQSGQVLVRARNRETGQNAEFAAERLLIAAGRASNGDLLRTDRAGLQTDSQGWLIVNDRLETSVKNIWSLMYTDDQSPTPLVKSMHIHPSLSEVVELAFFNLMMRSDYQHLLSHMAPELFPE
mgnify:FL=1